MSSRVLIVDDALFMRTLLRDVFEAAGWDVVAEADNGEQAVDLYRKQQPDLVTMDLVMPQMDGLDALKKILRIDSQARIVVCSALDQKQLVLEAISAGARDFIVKPFQGWQVMEVAERVILQ